MKDKIKEQMNKVMKTVDKENVCLHAARLITMDLYTICPEAAMEKEGELIAELEKQAFEMRNDRDFVDAVSFLYDNNSELNEYEKALVGYYTRKRLYEKNLTSKTAYEFSKTEKKAFEDWSQAKENSDFSLFKNSFKDVISVNRKKAELREKTPEEEALFKDDYDVLLDFYDRGMTTGKLDECFSLIKDRIIRLINDISKSPKQIRTDFLYRPVKEESQKKAAEYLHKVLGLPPERTVISTSKHGFSLRIDEDDVRLSTSYNSDCFLSNIYTVIHEAGHSLFELLSPKEDNIYGIYENKTTGMHESVSRFYENILGRSEAFIQFIYPGLKEIFPEILGDVTQRQLYEAVNFVKPGLIRVDADEVTYTLHILIRYELEKEIFLNKADPEDLPDLWNKKYAEYLGLMPQNDSEGILQDIQWTSDFGYFPVYCLGNFYNTMYYKKMAGEVDLEELLKNGDFERINEWMADNVFKKADILSPEQWIEDITGEALTPIPFIEYLEEKYKKIYML